MNKLLWLLLCGVPLIYGAAVPQRARRSTYAHSFNYPYIGIEGGFSFKDAANKAKGGKLDISIDNLKRLIPSAHSHAAKFSLDFDGGASPRDGVFKLTLDYELNHGSKETGVITVDSKLVSGEWIADIVGQPKTNAERIPPFKLQLKTDLFSYLTLTQINGTPLIEILAEPIHEAKISGRKIDLYMPFGTITAKLKEHEVSKIRTLELYENNNMFGKIEIDNKSPGAGVTSTKIDYLLDLNKIGAGNDEGKIRYTSDANGFEYIISSKYVPEVKASLKRQVNGNAIKWKGLYTHGANVLIDYDGKFSKQSMPNGLKIEADSSLKISQSVQRHPIFCLYGCFAERVMKAKFDITKPAFIVGSMELIKDNENVFSLQIDTKKKPATLSIAAPNIIPRLLNTGKASVDFSLDYNVDMQNPSTSFVRLTSDLPGLTSLSLENVDPKGEWIDLLINGQKLCRYGFSVGVSTLYSSVIPPNGVQYDSTIKWSPTYIDHKLNGTDGTNIKTRMKWDVKDPTDMTLKLFTKGSMPSLGEFELQRNLYLQPAADRLAISFGSLSKSQRGIWMDKKEKELVIVLPLNIRDFQFKYSEKDGSKSTGFNINM